eukprot:TRINITY_DN2521_c0_g5_i1.p1 TRINITY_DN2521_c0_g5~~TRINITY_DN2521_c0_g5_i1.p1  ORF type:complete len:192 (-),score=11.09 TRINITY_DN2521_c0_g5_i1:44-619(-)
MYYETEQKILPPVAEIFAYTTIGASVLFLILDIGVLASSIDLQFLVPFLLALLIFLAKVINVIGLYFLIKNENEKLGKIFVSIGFVIMLIAVLIIAMEILSFTKDWQNVVANVFFLYYSLVVITDLIVLITIRQLPKLVESILKRDGLEKGFYVYQLVFANCVQDSLLLFCVITIYSVSYTHLTLPTNREV